LGNNSPLGVIKAINNFGAVGFYYWQIIQLAEGKPIDLSLKVFKSFLGHITRDFKSNMARKKIQKATND